MTDQDSDNNSQHWFELRTSFLRWQIVPVTKQGWLATLLFVAVCFASTIGLDLYLRPLQEAGTISDATAHSLLISCPLIATVLYLLLLIKKTVRRKQNSR